MIIISDDASMVQRFVDLLVQRFSLKDLGPLAFFLGVKIGYFCLNDNILWIFLSIIR